MAKTALKSILALEKQRATLEKRIINAKQKQVTQREKQLAKQQSRIVKLQAQQKALRSPNQPHPSEKKRSKVKQKLIEARLVLKPLKDELKAAKTAYQHALFLQKAKVLAGRAAAVPRRKKKRVLGPKIKTQKVPASTIVPPTFLNIDTQQAVT